MPSRRKTAATTRSQRGLDDEEALDLVEYLKSL
jgi:hypothetical protein